MGGTKRIRLALKGAEQIPVQASIAPITSSTGDFHLKWKSLANLREVERHRDHPKSVFQGFLPKKSVSVGDTWKIDREAALQLLKQLAEKPQFKMRISPGTIKINIGSRTFEIGRGTDGLWALLRAYNDTYAEIVFRIHAEFALEDGWFTPSQFAGRLVIDRTQAKVAFFEMSVPEGTLNFDVNRQHKNSSSYETDAGFCPQIGLLAGTQAITSDTQFTEAITQEEAERRLIHRFYKSEQIEWVAMDKALEIARSLQRPIHVVSINGPLTDEAC